MDLVYKKTGLRLSKIKLVETNAVWGLMTGFPSKPFMVISRDAYNNFTKDEMDWLLLHEAGHYVLRHIVKMGLLQLALLVLGIFVLSIFPQYRIVYSVIISIILSIVYVQIARRFEYEANYFALSRMDNPKGLRNMLDKAKARWRSKGRKNDSFWNYLFNIWVLDIYGDLVKRAT